MTDNKLVDIKTGQPVKPSGVSHGEQRKILIQDGKRWQMMLEEMSKERISVTVTAAGQELDIVEIIAPYLDSLIKEDEAAKKITKRRERYYRTEK